MLDGQIFADWSRPVRARGLKLHLLTVITHIRQSRPVRARGLKLRPLYACILEYLSRPVRARGLKHTPALPDLTW